MLEEPIEACEIIDPLEALQIRNFMKFLSLMKKACWDKNSHKILVVDVSNEYVYDVLFLLWCLNLFHLKKGFYSYLIIDPIILLSLLSS